MNTKDIYKKQFEQILDREKKARDLYQYYITRTKDANLLKKFQEILQDEIEHIRIAQTFVDIISKSK